MLLFKYSVPREYPFCPTLSNGYADIASILRPEGRLTLAASHTNALEAAQATSRLFFIVKCQVRFPLPVGRTDDLPISSALMIETVLSLPAAMESFFISSAVNTCAAFCKSPDPYTIISAGAVM